MSTIVVQTRMPKEDRDQAEAICKKVGISLNDAFRIFSRAIINTQSVPVNMAIINSNDGNDLSVQERVAIYNYENNPEIATDEEVLAVEKQLGIKLLY